MKAILKYPGGKWRIADWIISHFPQHKVYCEPFFGSGAVFFSKSPSYIETINDIDGNIVNLFKVLRERPKELEYALQFTPFAREEFAQCENLDISDPIEKARRTLVRYHQSYGTANMSKSTWRNVQVAGGPRTATMWNALQNRICEVSLRLKEAQIECIDALKIIERYNSPETLIYCDPPYLPEIRRKDLYRFEVDTKYHERLLELLLETKSKVVLSGYDNPLYDEKLKEWQTDEMETTAQQGLKRKEKIWFNYELQFRFL